MVDDRLRKLISRLLERTRAKELQWREGLAEDEFQADFPSYSVSLSASEDEDATNWIALSIMDGKGTRLETVHEADLRDQVATREAGLQLEELYNAARRQALGVDRALDELLEQIG